MRFVTPIIVNEIISNDVFIAKCFKCNKAYLSVKGICGCSKYCNKKLREKRRRARELDNRKDIGVNVKNALLRFGRVCVDCKEITAHSQDISNPKKATIEHKIPLSLGGHHSWDNVEILCAECNSKRNIKTILEGKENERD